MIWNLFIVHLYGKLCVGNVDYSGFNTTSIKTHICNPLLTEKEVDNSRTSGMVFHGYYLAYIYF